MSRALSAAFGAVMVLTAALDSPPVTLAILAAAAAAVAAGLFHRRAAVVAVLLTIVALAFGTPTSLYAAVSGLAAATYLLTRYGDGATTLTGPAVAGLIGFTLAGLVATAITATVTWVPLLAPLVMAVVLVVVAIPLLGSNGRVPGPAGDDDPASRYE